MKTIRKITALFLALFMVIQPAFTAFAEADASLVVPENTEAAEQIVATSSEKQEEDTGVKPVTPAGQTEPSDFFFPENLEITLTQDGYYRISWDYEEEYDDVVQVGAKYYINGSYKVSNTDVKGIQKITAEGRVYYDEYTTIPKCIDKDGDKIGVYLVFSKKTLDRSAMSTALSSSEKTVLVEKTVADLPETRIASPGFVSATTSAITFSHVADAIGYNVTIYNKDGTIAGSSYSTITSGTQDSVNVSYYKLDATKEYKVELVAVANHNNNRNSEARVVKDVFQTKTTGRVVEETDGRKHAAPDNVQWTIEDGQVVYSWEDVEEITDPTGWYVDVTSKSYDQNGNIVAKRRTTYNLSIRRANNLEDGVITDQGYDANVCFNDKAQTHGVKVMYFWLPEGCEEYDTAWFSQEYSADCPRNGTALGKIDRESVTFEDGILSFEGLENEDNSLLGYFVEIPAVYEEIPVEKAQSGNYSVDVSGYEAKLIKKGSFQVNITAVANLDTAMSGTAAKVTFEYDKGSWQQKSLYITEENGIRHTAPANVSWSVNNGGVVIETWDDLDVEDPENWQVRILQKVYNKNGELIYTDGAAAKLTQHRTGYGTQQCYAYRDNMLFGANAYRFGIQVMYVSFYQASNRDIEPSWYSDEYVQDCPRNGSALGKIDADKIVSGRQAFTFEGLNVISGRVIGYKAEISTESHSGTSVTLFQNQGVNNVFTVPLQSFGGAEALEESGELTLTVTAIANLSNAMSGEPMQTTWTFEDNNWVRKPAETYTISFDANEGTGSMDDMEITEGESATVPACTFTKGREVFYIWTTEEDGYGIGYVPGDVITPTKDMTLYAQWRKTGWQEVDGEWYYFEEDGSRRTNQWIKTKFGFDEEDYTREYWYYLTADGSRSEEGVSLIDKQYYLFDGMRRRTSGLVVGITEDPTDPTNFVWESDIVFKTKMMFENYEVEEDEAIMYFSYADGKMMTGVQSVTIDGKTFSVNFDQYGCALLGINAGKIYHNGILCKAGGQIVRIQYADRSSTTTYPVGYYLINAEGNILSNYRGKDADDLWWTVKEPQQIFKMRDKEYAEEASAAVAAADMEDLLDGKTTFAADNLLYAVEVEEKWLENGFYYSVDWKRDTTTTFIITWKNDDGTVLATDEVLNGETPKYTGTTPTKAESAEYTYTFDGWDKDPIPVTGPATYTAKYKKIAKSYTIIFDSNGGNSSSSMKVAYGAAIPKPANPTRTGYTFTKWDPAIPATMPARNLTVKAQWTANKYTIKFSANGGTGTMASLTSVSYGTTKILTANAFKRTGYTFGGWSTTSTGSAKYKDKASVSNLSSTNGATVTLYAVWTKTKYTITYNLNGGTNNSKNPASYDVTTATITLQNPTKTGYTFGGWYGESTFKTKVTSITKGSTGNKTFYAKWTANKYTIKFSANGGTGTMASLTNVAYGTSKTLTANAYKRTGYTFSGWSTTSTGAVKYKDKASVSNLSSTNGATVTLYAVWTKTKYTITYNLNGGTNNSKNPASYDVTTATITLQSPSKTGYTFGGWYSDSALKTKVTTIAKGSTGNKTFYAKWTANTYTIKFNANGGTGTMKDLTKVAYGTTKALTANTFKRTGYTFAGWSTTKTGSVKYKDKAGVKSLTATNNGTVTLYAVWTKVTYKITYNLNGGKNNTKNPASYNVTTANITLQSPTKTGYTFEGWYSDSKFKTKVTVIKKGSTGNVTLYAKWKKK